MKCIKLWYMIISGQKVLKRPRCSPSLQRRRLNISTNEHTHSSLCSEKHPPKVSRIFLSNHNCMDIEWWLMPAEDSADCRPIPRCSWKRVLIRSYTVLIDYYNLDQVECFFPSSYPGNFLKKNWETKWPASSDITHSVDQDQPKNDDENTYT